jgi:hypothetical protein
MRQSDAILNHVAAPVCTAKAQIDGLIRVLADEVDTADMPIQTISCRPHIDTRL